MEINLRTETFELWKGKNGFANIPHVHPDWYQVTLPVKGTCDLQQGRRSYQLAAGDGLLQQPDTEHSFQVGESSAVIVIKIRNSLLKRSPQGGLPEYRPERNFAPGEISALFRHWSSDLLDNETDALVTQQLEVQVLRYLEYLLGGKDRGKPEGTLQSGLCPPAGDPHMARVLDYLHSCYMTPVDIESMANIALQSRAHFIRSFKQLTQLTPYQYVLRLRINEAERMLQQSGATVTEISFSLGFSSVTQFYRAFQRIKGMTPTEYRRSVK